MAYYAWSKIEAGDKSAMPGDSVSGAKLGLSEDQFDELVQSGVVREMKYLMRHLRVISHLLRLRSVILQSQPVTSILRTLLVTELLKRVTISSVLLHDRHNQ